MTRYVLTGTSGNLGSRILRSVIARGEIRPSDVVISTSSPRSVPSSVRDRGFEVRRGDYADPASLRTAFDGADVVFVMSHPDPGTRRVALHRNAFEAAWAAGATVVYSSMMLGGEAGTDTVIGIQQGHAQTMRYLYENDGDHIIVRQGIYAEAWGHYAGFPRRGAGGRVEWVVPRDIAVAWTALDELGEGNAALLARYGDYVGNTLRLTGPRATKISEIAEHVAALTGREIVVTELGIRGSDSWNLMYQGLAAGEGSVVDPLLGELLGRAPRGIEELPDHLFRVA
ncbi:NAD(P)H-binding protein [Microbacterium rhizophilus]|uniref:NAD(P)H-binding protein n=1 Tax=Microbacterium rhizophilus TaxID=3138934 RepID=UPI0031E64434